MDLFFSSIPINVSDRTLESHLRDSFKPYGLDVFVCKRRKNRSCALVTVLDVVKGSAFLADFEAASSARPKRELQIQRQRLRVSLSRTETDPFMLRSLDKETKDQQEQKPLSTKSQLRLTPEERSILTTGVICGLWDYIGEDLCFCPQATLHYPWILQFGRRLLVLEYEPRLQYGVQDSTTKLCRLDIGYLTIQSIALGYGAHPSVTMRLSECPRVYRKLLEKPRTPDPIGALFKQLAGLKVSSTAAEPPWERLKGLTLKHEEAIGGCFTYQIHLPHISAVKRFGRICHTIPQMPVCIPRDTKCHTTSEWKTQMEDLESCMGRSNMKGHYKLQFQLQRLAQNGYLTPRQTKTLIPEVSGLLRENEADACGYAIARMSRHIPFPGPDKESRDFEAKRLTDMIIQSLAIGYRDSIHYHSSMRNHPHIRLIHRAIITPAGVYLEGPEPETINRVIRALPGSTDHFLRVEFCDEDFERLWFGGGVSLESVVRKTFQTFLDQGIRIAGHHFDFLGFSHSSLRNQSVWFLSPVEHDNRSINARAVIAGLGDFSHIRSPARMAARIGQAFTDTSGVVPLPPGSVSIISDLQKGNRCFSDGVGTISKTMLSRIWDYHPRSGRMEPKLYQIRCAGAKGMVALDGRLEGDQLRLRPSMIKFEGTPKTQLEICGASTKPLALRLNRQYVKVFEDLGIPESVFLQLQSEAIAKLRRITANPINAAAFLDHERACQVSGVPNLIRNLYYAGFDYREDPFLRSVVDLAVLVRLRDIKHRAKINIDEGSLLYGIMDESASLKESEVFCCVDGRIIQGAVVVARSPALHPGDVQLATAVTPAQGSLLLALDNCIAFSQHGIRDLPSQLSGGDLDGDEFAVIWDNRLHPPRTVEPADYPAPVPSDIGEKVTVQHMTEFFLNFMENDQLGRIANLHLQLADRYGSKSEDCLLLAELHSTAVDFSKTGVPVDMSRCPRSSRVRPDFMAPSPRTKIVADTMCLELGEETVVNKLVDEDELVDALDPNAQAFRYYESQNVLGKLYRQINEREFLEELQSNARKLADFDRNEDSMILRLWHYVQTETADIKWMHLQSWARDVKESYEALMVDAIHQFSSSLSESISENEVFVGTILGGKGGAVPSRRAKKAKKDMKEMFDWDIELTISSINKGSDGEDPGHDEALPRAIACLAVSVEPQEKITLRKMEGRLQSFRYVSAAICLAEMAKREKETVVWPGRLKTAVS